MNTTAATTTTEDGAVLSPGDRAFNYYDQKPGVIAGDIDSSGWFTFNHDDGTSSLLNGERICTLAFAARRGWVTIDLAGNPWSIRCDTCSPERPCSPCQDLIAEGHEHADDYDPERDDFDDEVDTPDDYEGDLYVGAPSTEPVEVPTTTVEVSFFRVSRRFDLVFANGVRGSFVTVGDFVAWLADRLPLATDSAAVAAAEVAQDLATGGVSSYTITIKA